MLSRSAAFALLFLPLSLAPATLNCQERVCPLQIIANVRDQHGEFIDNLAPRAFRALGPAAPITISSAKSVFGATRAVVVVDASGSMKVSDNLWNATRGVAEDFIISLPAPTKIGLLAFASRPLARLGFDHSRKELLQTVHDLGTTGKDLPVKAAQTALWDSLIQTSELFGQPQPGDSVVVISDGGDNRSKAHEDSVGRLFVEKGIRLFAVDLHHQNFQTEEERQGLESLGWLAHVTGGLTIADAEKFQYATKLSAADSFKELLSEIGDEITRYYVLELSEPTTKGKPTKWRLELTRDGSKRRDVVLTYPQRLVTCVALQAHK